MTVVARPIAKEEGSDTKQNPFVELFSETHSQKSPRLSLVIEAIKDPLRAIHRIGKEIGCSHYTNFPRTIERVLMTKRGQNIDIDYTEEKTLKTLSECFCSKFPREKKAEVSRYWRQTLENLENLEEAGVILDEQEQQIYSVAFQLILLFQGGVMPENFHMNKDITVNSYNQFRADFLQNSQASHN